MPQSAFSASRTAAPERAAGVDDCDDFLAALNAAQRLAVEQGVDSKAKSGGPLLVIAGAGSGKTHTLAYRVAHLVRSGADPQRILLLTFSRRAAAEMERRVGQLLHRSSALRRGMPPSRFAGRAPSTASARGSCGNTRRRSGCRIPSPSSIAATPRT